MIFIKMAKYDPTTAEDLDVSIDPTQVVWVEEVFTMNGVKTVLHLATGDAPVVQETREWVVAEITASQA